jgi:hypothetical protein
MPLRPAGLQSRCAMTAGQGQRHAAEPGVDAGQVDGRGGQGVLQVGFAETSKSEGSQNERHFSRASTRWDARPAVTRKLRAPARTVSIITVNAVVT